MSAALSIARIQPPGPLGARRDHGVPLSRIGRGCRRGFTLIEIMIVISIMMVVMTVGIPAFVRALDKQGLRKAVNDVVEGCSHARSQAILRGVPMEFVIRAEDFSLMVRPASGFSTGPTAPPVSVAESVVQTQAPAKTVPPFPGIFRMVCLSANCGSIQSLCSICPKPGCASTPMARATSLRLC